MPQPQRQTLTGVCVWTWPQVRIPANAITSSNPQVRARQLWGADVYTEDSDLVAVLMHTGHYTVSVHHAPASLAEVNCRKAAVIIHPLLKLASEIRRQGWARCNYRQIRAYLPPNRRTICLHTLVSSLGASGLLPLVRALTNSGNADWTKVSTVVWARDRCCDAGSHMLQLQLHTSMTCSSTCR